MISLLALALSALTGATVLGTNSNANAVACDANSMATHASIAAGTTFELEKDTATSAPRAKKASAIDTTVSLRNVTVVAASTKKALTPVQSMSGRELSSLSSSSIADALKFFAGVQIKDYGGVGGQKTINVRSLGTQHTGIFLDGIRITNTQNGTVDLGKYSLQNMEAVELYNANKVSPLMSASEYASGATVYLRTARPTTTGLEIRGQTGSFHTGTGQIHYSIKDRFFADYTLQSTKGDYKFHYHSEYEDTTGHRRNSDVFLTRLETGWFAPHIRTHGYLYYSDRGLPGGIVRRLSDKYGDVGRETDLNWFLQGSYDNRWHWLEAKFNARYAYDQLRYNTDRDDNYFVHYRNHYVQQDGYLSAVGAAHWKDFTLSLSPDLRLSDLNCNVYGMRYILRTDYKTSLALQYQHKALLLNVSGLYTNIKDHSNITTADRLSRITWGANGSYSLNKRLALRAFYKTVFRAPTLNDLYYTQVGRRNLKPEYTHQTDIGATYNLSWLNIQIDGYYNTVHDKIICVPQGGSYQWKMMNRGYVQIWGADLSARARCRYGSLFFTATLQDVRDKTDRTAGDYDHLLLYTPRFSFSTVLTLTPWKGLSASVSHMFVSKRYWTYSQEYDVLPYYNCTDMKLQYEAAHWRVALDIDNIFNNYYELVQRWPLPARRWQLTFGIKI